MFNVAISNVPGPTSRCILRAKLEASIRYRCCSMVSLDVTCVSYAGKLNFGYTAARHLAHMQRWRCIPRGFGRIGGGDRRRLTDWHMGRQTIAGLRRVPESH